MSAEKRRRGERGGRQRWVLWVAEQREGNAFFLWVVFVLEQLFKTVTASHIKIAAFPSSCRGNHVSTGRARIWEGGNKELKKEEGPIEGEMPPPPPSSAGLFSLFGFLFYFKT